MKKILLLLILLITRPCLAGEFSDCILDNMKGVATQSGAFQIRQACKEKALPYVPAKCYVSAKDLSSSNPFDKFVRLPDNKDEDCINNCMNASYWSKRFGDCKE